METKLKQRNINYLLHFTNYTNLPSIMANGLVRRSELDNRAMAYEFNDQIRLDGHPNSLSVSIGFPNYRMFYPARCNRPADTWVVLALSTDILLHKPCSYFPKNAATACYNGIDPTSLQNEWSFDAMFANVDGIERSNLDVPDDYTTDPQAEVLVFSDIEPKYITAIATQSKAQEQETKIAYPQLGDEIVHFSSFFSARKDYKHWQ